jgi:hypothetical protein
VLNIRLEALAGFDTQQNALAVQDIRSESSEHGIAAPDSLLLEEEVPTGAYN